MVRNFGFTKKLRENRQEVGFLTVECLCELSKPKKYSWQWWKTKFYNLFSKGGEE